MNGAPNFVVALSVDGDPVVAATEVADAARAGLGGATPTLAVIFVTPDLCTDPWSLLETLHERLAPEHLIGTTAESVIGLGCEVEHGPALSLWCAHLPDASVSTFRLVAEQPEDGYVVTGWPEAMPAADAAPMLVLADPFTLPADVLVAQHNAANGPPLIGGLSSGGARPGDHVIFHDRDAHYDGGVGVELSGVAVVPVVSQGCAPIGPDMVITDGGGPVIRELAGMTAFNKITGVVDELQSEERALLAQPLLGGLVINENQPEYGRGDFLIRGIHGRDPETGAIYIGENVRVGQTFRLHVRDATSATEDLRHALRDARASATGLSPAGGLVFSCNGRGTNMFPTPDHDAALIADELGIPAAGMFCNGEIGPVGGKTFLHGFTATMALFLEPEPR